MEKSIQPSLLAFTKTQMREQIAKCAEIGISWIHYDVMHPNYVGATAYKFEYLDLIREHQIKVGVHLMTKNVVENVRQYLDKDVQAIVIHGDADITSNIHAALDLINQTPHIAAGLAIKTYEDLFPLIPFLKKVKKVVMMGVRPGAGGQKYLSFTTRKLRHLRQLILKLNLDIEIILDGGVRPNVIRLTRQYVDTYVTGSYLMAAPNFEQVYNDLLTIAQSYN
ncbi:ribulose-phosphate 3-epimerase [Mycoplasmoides fastidiosum]|uniref:Ribulose-phosphate 3-epimerase n=1 Tax=Mycoplasmoides fastidiosum TaxID=92758 RepID=A0ABU0LZB6_9BACT|nr:hypothetical protein [Mycoplasmoides fastidiosum]MDQ0514045.1 ribulose-phosphate 3-epimerase [Mycoplasmoides fastidiosum]UUD37545.1 hypothetical protein NPA10_03180 [Mycoplasmoides fastidiosum]